MKAICLTFSNFLQFGVIFYNLIIDFGHFLPTLLFTFLYFPRFIKQSLVFYLTQIFVLIVVIFTDFVVVGAMILPLPWTDRYPITSFNRCLFLKALELTSDSLYSLIMLIWAQNICPYISNLLARMLSQRCKL